MNVTPDTLVLSPNDAAVLLMRPESIIRLNAAGIQTDPFISIAAPD
jgi:hypothetical protein